MASRRKSSKEVTPIAPEKPRRGRPRKAGPAPEYELTAKGKEVVSGLNGQTNGALSGHAHANGAAQVEVKGSGILSGPRKVEGFLYFTNEDRLLYENKQLLVQMARQKVAMKQLEILQTKSAYDEKLRKLDQELATVVFDTKASEKDLLGLQTEIADVYGIDLQKIAYDPVSGRITISV